MAGRLSSKVVIVTGGSIINNASIGGVRGIPGLAPYVAAKRGVVGLTRSAALAIDGGATA